MTGHKYSKKAIEWKRIGNYGAIRAKRDANWHWPGNRWVVRRKAMIPESEIGAEFLSVYYFANRVASEINADPALK